MICHGRFLIVLAVGVLCSDCDSTPRVHAKPLTSPRSLSTRVEAARTCGGNDRCVERYCDQVAIDESLFRMGSNEETRAVPPQFLGGLDHFGSKTPAHDVRLSAFCIDKYEVTMERYASCVEAGVCDPTGCQWPNDPVPNSWREVVVNHYPPDCETNRKKCSHHPVNCKTYRQAETYCRWIGRRLCTETEWERAARGPLFHDRSRYPWGKASIDSRRANVPEFGPGHLVAVDRYAEGASAEGVFNLVGNVFEWVSDYYAPYNPFENASAAFPSAPGDRKYRVARGGCFFLNAGHNNTDRLTLDAAFDWGCIGFRCCSDPVTTERHGKP